MLIPEESPLRTLPLTLSRNQILIFDGIRYATEMTVISYDRLYNQLQAICGQEVTPLTSKEISSALLDAWSIIDSVHRFHDLIQSLPGLEKKYWQRLLTNRLADALTLRDRVQHQLQFLNELINSHGQMWGYLSWAEVKNHSHTGRWFMISPGTVYVDDQWYFIGPFTSRPLGHIRLNAYNVQVYLGRCVEAVAKAVNFLVAELSNGSIRLVGEAATERRGTDYYFTGGLMIEYADKNPPSQ